MRMRSWLHPSKHGSLATLWRGVERSASVVVFFCGAFWLKWGAEDDNHHTENADSNNNGSNEKGSVGVGRAFGSTLSSSGLIGAFRGNVRTCNLHECIECFQTAVGWGRGGSSSSLY